MSKTCPVAKARTHNSCRRGTVIRITALIIGLFALSACSPGGNARGDGSRIADRFLQADANGDGVLSRDEAPSRLDFDAADTDGDGLLTLGEVEAFTRAMRA